MSEVVEMINQKLDIRKDFQNFPVEAPVELNVEEINRTCDKLITELKSIAVRIYALQSMTKCCGPAIDAERSINVALKCLARQKR